MIEHVHRFIRMKLLTFGGLGVLLFFGLFALTFVQQETIERVGQEFIQTVVVEKAQAQSDRFLQTSLGQSTSDRFEKGVDVLKRKMGRETTTIEALKEARISEAVGAIIAQMCRLDCEGTDRVKEKWTGFVDKALDGRLSSSAAASEKLTEFVQGKYVDTLTALRRDVRIFLGTNGVVFLMLLLIAIFKRRAVRHLYLPGALLLVSTLTMINVYLFGQNWFFTIIYNDYMGWGYVAYLAIVFSFLMDIAFNRARITTKILNGIANLFGSALSFSPC